MSEQRLTFEVIGVEDVQAMLAVFTGDLMEAHLKASVRAAAVVYREAVPLAAPKLVGPKLRDLARSEHEGPPFWADITPANNLWNMFEKGRKAGYSIPAVRKNQRTPLNKILAGYEFGPVRGPVYGGAMAPRPFLGEVLQDKADEAGRVGMDMLMSFIQ